MKTEIKTELKVPKKFKKIKPGSYSMQVTKIKLAKGRIIVSAKLMK